MKAVICEKFEIPDVLELKDIDERVPKSNDW